MITKEKIIAGAKKYKCDLCDDEFYSQHSSPAYCSSKCKQQAYIARKNEPKEQPKEENIMTKKTELVTYRRDGGKGLFFLYSPSELKILREAKVVDKSWWTEFLEMEVDPDDKELIQKLKKLNFKLKKI